MNTPATTPGHATLTPLSVDDIVCLVNHPFTIRGYRFIQEPPLKAGDDPEKTHKELSWDITPENRDQVVGFYRIYRVGTSTARSSLPLVTDVNDHNSQYFLEATLRESRRVYIKDATFVSRKVPTVSHVKLKLPSGSEPVKAFKKLDVATLATNWPEHGDVVFYRGTRVKITDGPFTNQTQSRISNYEKGFYSFIPLKQETVHYTWHSTEWVGRDKIRFVRHGP
ncbi:hypothetical protein CPC08DRAFT_713374 [Agrocybe pediades]|nr:hypothetical protein CPC08DRAFT_713374 [Agrocybe pediades]